MRAGIHEPEPVGFFRNSDRTAPALIQKTTKNRTNSHRLLRESLVSEIANKLLKPASGNELSRRIIGSSDDIFAHFP